MRIRQLALIGSPVIHSKSDSYHNYFLSQLGLPAKYLKAEVTPEQLPHYLQDAKQNNFLGLSVTMPLKTAIMPYLDELKDCASAVGAVNTVHMLEGKTIGYNTDAIGALQAIKQICPYGLKDKRVVIVGAGGVAKAIAWVLKQEGMIVTLSNRTDEKAKALADALSAQICSFTDLREFVKTECDLLINATSVGMQDNETILPAFEIPKQVIVFDVISAPKNGWLEALSQQGNLTISGKLFWIYQAIAQHKIWFGKEAIPDSAFSVFQRLLS